MQTDARDKPPTMAPTSPNLVRTFEFVREMKHADACGKPLAWAYAMKICVTKWVPEAEKPSSRLDLYANKCARQTVNHGFRKHRIWPEPLALHAKYSMHMRAVNH